MLGKRGALWAFGQIGRRISGEAEEGQTLVEYGLLLAFIAIILILALLFLGPIVSMFFQNVGTSVEGA